ncbi:MAG: non-canonical purine NTP pyrophosphatase [Flavobacteriales bacterium]
MYSAGYVANEKGQDNIQKLLEALENISERTARLICVICLKTRTRTRFFFEGTLSD